MRFKRNGRGFNRLLEKNRQLDALLLEKGEKLSENLSTTHSEGISGQNYKNNEKIIGNYNTFSGIVNSSKVGWFASKPRNMYVFKVDFREKDYKKPVMNGMKRFGKND